MRVSLTNEEAEALVMVTREAIQLGGKDPLTQAIRKIRGKLLDDPSYVPPAIRALKGLR